MVVDKQTGLVWQKNEAGEYRWADAVDYCQALNLAGKTDWRLPNKEELASSHRLAFEFPHLADSYYWSSTTDVKFNFRAWGLTT